MSRRLSVLVAIVLVLLVGALAPPPEAGSQVQDGATMTVLRGQVAVIRTDGSALQPAPSGSTVFAGDEIRTISASGALITFFSGTEIELGEDTILVVEQVSRQGDRVNVSLKQVFGISLNRIQTFADPGSSYRIDAGGAVALVRGTEFIVLGPFPTGGGDVVIFLCFGDCTPNTLFDACRAGPYLGFWVVVERGRVIRNCEPFSPNVSAGIWNAAYEALTDIQRELEDAEGTQENRAGGQSARKDDDDEDDDQPTEEPSPTSTRPAAGVAASATATPGATSTAIPTGTPSPIATPTSTGTPTQTPTRTVTPTSTGTAIGTPTATATGTPTASTTPTPTGTATNTTTPTSTSTSTPTPSPTGTPIEVDLALVKTEGIEQPDPILQGADLRYRLTITNNSPSIDSTGFTVTDTLPTGVTYDDSSSDPACEETAPGSGVVECTVAALGAADSIDLEILVQTSCFTPTGEDALLNEATISSANEPDSNSGNDSSDESTSVTFNSGCSEVRGRPPSLAS